MSDGIIFYIKPDSVAGVYPYIHKKVTVGGEVILDTPVELNSIDEELKTQYAAEVASVLSTFSASLSSGSFSGGENIVEIFQLSRLLATIASNISDESIDNPESLA